MKTNALLDELIDIALLNNIEIRIVKHNGMLAFDLDTRAKSQLIVRAVAEDLVVYGRYEYVSSACTLRDVLLEIKNAMHGRDYLNPNWIKVLVDNGVLKQHVTYSYSYS